MGFICACCFAAGESEKCAVCEKQPCPDCKADKVLLKVEEDHDAPALDAEDYDGFLRKELSEEGVSAADVRYAVALRSFGKLKQERKGPKVFHLDPAAAAKEEKPF